MRRKWQLYGVVFSLIFVVVCSGVWPKLSVTFALVLEVRAARSRSSESHRLLPGSVSLVAISD